MPNFMLLLVYLVGLKLLLCLALRLTVSLKLLYSPIAPHTHTHTNILTASQVGTHYTGIRHGNEIRFRVNEKWEKEKLIIGVIDMLCKQFGRLYVKCSLCQASYASGKHRIICLNPNWCHILRLQCSLNILKIGFLL